MGDDKRRQELPNVSDIFKVDENEIPAGLIPKPKEPQRRVSSYRSDAVLSRTPEGSGSQRAAASEENRRGYAARKRAEYEEEQRRAKEEQRTPYSEEFSRGRVSRQRGYGDADPYADNDADVLPPLRRQAAQYEAGRAYRASRHDDLYADSRRENSYRNEGYREDGYRRDPRREEAGRAYPRAERINDEQEEARRRQQRQRAGQKRRLMRLVPGVVVPVLLFIGVIAVILAVKVNHTPKVLTAAVKNTSVENYTSFDAVAVNDPAETDEDRVYAVFVCNNYDAVGISDGSKVNLVFGGGKSVSGGVTQIMEKDAEDPLLETIGAALPQTSVSPEENHVVVVLPDDSSACEEGDVMEAQVVTEASVNAPAVPVTALRTDGAKIYVWVYKESGLSKKIEQRYVSVGVVSAEFAEVTDGLKSGEKVVVGSDRTPDTLLDGMRVRLEATSEVVTAAQQEEN